MDYWRDKVAIVTGGSSGLGLALARELANRQARVVLAARGIDRLQAAAEQLRDAGHPPLLVPTDVTQPDQVESLVARTVSEHGRLDLFVNNAGRSSRGEAITTAPETYRQLLEMNFLSVVHGSQASVPHLADSHGHLVNIGSLAAKSASRYLGAYPASKFPVAAFSQQLRYELEPQGVHVLLVCPGPIARPDAGLRYEHEAQNLPDKARQPGGGVRLSGISPDILAGKILYACERRRPELVVPGKARLLFAISQLWPTLGDRILSRMT